MAKPTRRSLLALLLAAPLAWLAGKPKAQAAAPAAAPPAVPPVSTTYDPVTPGTMTRWVYHFDADGERKFVEGPFIE
jgi:hypothetical protein